METPAGGLASETILEILRMILAGTSLKDVLTSVARVVEAQREGMLCSVSLLDPDRIHMRAIAAPTLPSSYVAALDGFALGPEGGSCGAAVNRREPVFVTDVLTDPILERVRDVITAHGLRACWSAPIISQGGEILGTFAFYFRSVRGPSPSDLELIESATRLAAIAIERKVAEDAVRASEAKLREDEEELRRIVDAIPQKIIVLNPEGRVIYANRVCLDYSGLSLEDVRADDFRERVFHPEDVQRLREERQKALAGTVPFENEQRALGKDGKYRWLLIQYNPLLDREGKIVRWYATGTDIEDRKRAEEKLRDEGRELRQLIDSIPQHVLVLNAKGSLLQANQVMLDYNGRSLKEMQGAGTSDRITRDLHPDDLERVQAERERGLSKGLPFEMEKRMLGKDGRFRWFLFRYNPLRNEEGKIERWLATATDIEDRKQAEDRMRNETVALREEIVHSSLFEEIVGTSEALRRVLLQVSKVAPTDSTVLIVGETGTGKELIARAIHNRSKRSSRAFIRVSCAAIPPSLVASELFGHEKGSFTGAFQRRPGRFELADGGTIFLDEVGELPPETQIALLRVLQEREFERVGGTEPLLVDVRVLAATNRDLSAAVGEGKFRQDLFYRLNVFPLQLPPLRERADDIPLLVEYLIDRYARKAGRKIRKVAKRTLHLFQAYDWPGNIRELQNVVERAIILCEGETFSVDETWLTPANSAGTDFRLGANLAEREKEMIESSLRNARGVIGGPNGAAVKLGVPRQTLESRIRKLGINRHRFRTP